MNSIFPKSDYFNKYLGCEWIGRGEGEGGGYPKVKGVIDRCTEREQIEKKREREKEIDR